MKLKRSRKKLSYLFAIVCLFSGSNGKILIYYMSNLTNSYHFLRIQIVLCMLIMLNSNYNKVYWVKYKVQCKTQFIFRKSPKTS